MREATNDERNNADDEFLPVNQAVGEVIPGKRNPATHWRWITRGLAGAEPGERIKLRVWYAGRQPLTTRAAVREFLDAVTAARLARIERIQQCGDVTAEDLVAAGLR